jgi:Ran GTPase-activating protein (RanGAP) involved in mRNA processing and transport
LSSRRLLLKKRCKGLNLTSNNITAAGAWILARALNNNYPLKTLSLHGNQICDEDAYSLVNVLANNSVINDLNLVNTGITDDGVKYLVQMIKANKSLANLWLCKNKISDVGVQILADAIVNHNTTLRLLSLRDNMLLTNASVDSLIQMIKYSRSVAYLFLAYSNFSLTGKERLLKAHQPKPNLKMDIE